MCAKKSTVVFLFASVVFGLMFSAAYQASALTREDCQSSQYEAESECLQYLREASGVSEDGKIATFGGLISTLRNVLDTIVPFLIALAVFVIIWGVFKYLSGAGDEEKRAEARLFIVWGVVGVFAMISVWGFVNILVNTLPLRKTPVPVGSVFPTN